MTSFDRLSVIEIAAEVGAGRRSAVDVAARSAGAGRRLRSGAARGLDHRASAKPRCSPRPRRWTARRRRASACRSPASPFAVKDNIDVAGLPTTAACPAFAYMPDATAPVVERLIAAGAVLIGKTNLDQFATGLVGTRSPYGALRRGLQSRVRQRRLELRLGGGGGGRPGRLRARHRHRRLRPRAGGVQPPRRPQADQGPLEHARRRAGLPQRSTASPCSTSTAADAARGGRRGRRLRPRRSLFAARAVRRRPSRIASGRPAAAGPARLAGRRARRRVSSGARSSAVQRNGRAAGRGRHRAAAGRRARCSTTDRGWPSGPRRSRACCARNPAPSSRRCARSCRAAGRSSAVDAFKGRLRAAGSSSVRPRRCGRSVDALLLPTDRHHLPHRAR